MDKLFTGLTQDQIVFIAVLIGIILLLAASRSKWKARYGMVPQATNRDLRRRRKNLVYKGKYKALLAETADHQESFREEIRWLRSLLAPTISAVPSCIPTVPEHEEPRGVNL